VRRPGCLITIQLRFDARLILEYHCVDRVLRTDYIAQVREFSES
jgi:hypothetical protein